MHRRFVPSAALALIVAVGLNGQGLAASHHAIEVFSGGIVDIDVSDDGVIANLGNIVRIGDPPHDFGSFEAWGGPFHNKTVTLDDISGKTAVIQLCLTNCPPCIDASNMFSMAFRGGGESYPNHWDLNRAYLFGLDLPPKRTDIASLKDLGDDLIILDVLFVRKLVGVQNRSTGEEATLYHQFGAKGFVGRLWNHKLFIPDALFPPNPTAIFAQERIHFDISLRKSVEQLAELNGVSLANSTLPKPGVLPGSQHISVLYDGSTEPQTGAGYDMAIAYGGKPNPNRPVVPRFIYVDSHGEVRANVIGTSAGARVRMARILALRDVDELTVRELVEHAVGVIEAQPSGVIPSSVESELHGHLADATSILENGGNTPAACPDLNAAGLAAENAYMYQVHPLMNDASRAVITRDEVTFEIILDIADAIKRLNCDV